MNYFNLVYTLKTQKKVKVFQNNKHKIEKLRSKPIGFNQNYLYNQFFVKIKFNAYTYYFYKGLLRNDFTNIYIYLVSYYLFNNFFIVNLIIFESYTYKLKLIIQADKYTKYYCKSKTLHNKFINLLCKQGLKLKYINMYSYIYTLFYKAFLYFDNNYSKNFPLYNSFYNLSKSNTIFYLIDYFYQLLFNQYGCIFFVKIAEIPKKLKKKKKSKKKYNLYFSYLKPINRFKWLLKQIILNNTTVSLKKTSNRIYFSILNTLLIPDNNFLKEQQIKIYKSILKSKKIT